MVRHATPLPSPRITLLNTTVSSYLSQRHVESLQTTVKRQEAELLGGQRREEALHAAAKILREKVAASKLEAWRLKVGERI